MSVQFLMFSGDLPEQYTISDPSVNDGRPFMFPDAEDSDCFVTCYKPWSERYLLEFGDLLPSDFATFNIPNYGMWENRLDPGNTVAKRKLARIFAFFRKAVADGAELVYVKMGDEDFHLLSQYVSREKSDLLRFGEINVNDYDFSSDNAPDSFVLHGFTFYRIVSR